ncbi:hypothetical protein AQUCO_02300055v1 [Aquilegia coerulea]|uniref:1-phosphatidylinositol-3-phosphate 5-kinase n=1 Tax=Aquilegia coerulea TaxID=218851 RepID=A0A2G5DBW0_AQUCA|nr:hypothetical protein AQUCO_02300055v1 [Aquilegia coerulea]
MGTADSPEGTEAGVYDHSFKSEKEETILFHSFDIDSLWLPPEPEYTEDDVEGSVANNNDDDEYGDGTKWGQPSSLSMLCEERSYKLKKEVQKEMRSIMKGKFKSIVHHLLESKGIILSKEAVNNWVDVVTSLALEAVFLIQSDASGTVDLKKQVKVKCIASGFCTQSQLINGLVFKKNASHKHMRTKYEKPKLLLLDGLLGHSSSGLSSFDSMEQENGNLKSIIETLEMCHPDVVLVEGTVSRDVQESLLAKGIALVFDMKHRRLERIARYTGSQIFSSPDSLISQKLKLCQSFHFEGFVEEHDILRESEKIPVKTLMFLEGCHRPFGFTILLKGAHSVELKKIKSVVHSVILMAYHLMLETSFLVDQRAMFSTIRSMEMDKSYIDQLPITGPSTLPNASLDKSLAATAFSFSTKVSFPDVAEETPACERRSSNFKMDLEQRLSLCGSDVNSYEADSGQTYDDSTYCDIEIKDNADVVGSLDGESWGSLSACHEVPVELMNYEEDFIKHKDVNTFLDPQSILYLESAQNVSHNKICKKRRLCRVKYYQNFDVSLGQYLRDTLLNQCLACNGPPQAHVYNYVHRNGKLTVRVQQLSAKSFMRGEAEGKLWMWAQCSKCEPMNKTCGSTRRVVLSPASQSLSFGKFLELSLSDHSVFNRLPKCGHSLQADYLQFYGLGGMVTMFTYSTVDIYTVCMPPPILEFKNPSGWIKDEAESNYGYVVCNSNSNPSMNQTDIVKQVSEMKNTLKQEKFDAEGEPTSIIACALAWLHGKHSTTEDVAEKDVKMGKVDFKGAFEYAYSMHSDVSVVSPHSSSNGSLDSYGIQSGESVSSEDSYASYFDGSNIVDQTQDPHIEIHLGTGESLRKGNYSVLCLHEKQFHDFRRRCCPCELDYISSLSRCKKWDAKGGKSGSLFVKTLDDGFIIKQIQKTEFDAFSQFGREYFKYTDQCFDSGNQTCLAKILGIYQVTIRQPKSGKDLKYNLMVMENLLFRRNITHLYDLKGLQHMRYTKDLDGGGNVFLDKNFVEDMNLSPLYLSEKTNRLLKRAIWNDTCFLSSINVMDYSLLLGVDMQRLEVVCGIIDYLRQYTWDKQFETIAKSSLLTPKNETPTVIPPKEYKKRFRKFMDSHILRIPDHHASFVAAEVLTENIEHTESK